MSEGAPRLHAVEDVGALPDAEFSGFCGEVLAVVMGGLHDLGYETVPTSSAVAILDPKSSLAGVNSWREGEPSRKISISKSNNASPAALINTVAHEAIHSTRLCCDSHEAHRLGFMEVAGRMNQAYALRTAPHYWRDDDALLPRSVSLPFVDMRGDEVYAAEHFGDHVQIDGEDYVLVGFHGKRAKDSEVSLVRCRDARKLHVPTSELLEGQGWMSERGREAALRRACAPIVAARRPITIGGHLYEADALVERSWGPMVRVRLVKRNQELARSRPAPVKLIAPEALLVRMGCGRDLWPRRYVRTAKADHPLSRLVSRYFESGDSWREGAGLGAVPATRPPRYRVVLTSPGASPSAMADAVASTRLGGRSGRRRKLLRLVSHAPSTLAETEDASEAAELVGRIGAAGGAAAVEALLSTGDAGASWSRVDHVHAIEVESTAGAAFAPEVVAADVEEVGGGSGASAGDVPFALGWTPDEREARREVDRLAAAGIRSSRARLDFVPGDGASPRAGMPSAGGGEIEGSGAAAAMGPKDGGSMR